MLGNLYDEYNDENYFDDVEDIDEYFDDDYDRLDEESDDLYDYLEECGGGFIDWDAWEDYF